MEILTNISLVIFGFVLGIGALALLQVVEERRDPKVTEWPTRKCEHLLRKGGESV